jgi:hypothetical protein
MATLRDFGYAPEEPESRQPRRQRYAIDDQSGARPLPRDDRDAYDTYDAYAVDPLDEDVELPGVSRNDRAGLWFGVGVGLGVVVLAVAGGLYLSGYVGRVPLAAGPEAPPLAAGARPIDDMLNEEALARARIAPVWISEAQVRPEATEQDSSDIQVIEQPPVSPTTPGAGAATEEGAPVSRPRSPGARRAVPSQEVSGEEMDVDAAVPSSPKSGTAGLSNELDRLQNSLTPRGPVAPKPPTNDPSAPEEPLPPPVAPTAPAETVPPGK